MARWTVSKPGEKVYLIVNNEKYEVESTYHALRPYVGFNFKSGDRKKYDLRKFEVKDDFSKKMKKASASRELFMKSLSALGSVPNDLKDKSDSDKTSEKDTSETDSDSSSSTDSSISSKTSEETANYLKEKELGIFDVHIENLQSPALERTVRPVNQGHLEYLEKSLLSNQIGQITTLIGMTSEGCQMEQLTTPHSTTIEVLGGNHTHLALKNLYRKGLVPASVKVRLYKPLLATESLKLGLDHNLATEAQRPMSFIDMVYLIRRRQPSEAMSIKETKAWKQDLLLIFGDKSLDLMEGRLQNHIKLSRVSEDVWRAIMSVDDSILKEVKQTFFKKMVGLPTDIQLKCVEALKSGETSFKSKVNEYREMFPKRKRKTPTSAQVKASEIAATANSTETEEDNVTVDETENDGYLVETSSNAGNISLGEEQTCGHTDQSIDEHTDQRINEHTDQRIEYNKGQSVWAEWKDGIMYEAVISKVEIVYQVVFKEDNKRRKVSPEQIKQQEDINI